MYRVKSYILSGCWLIAILIISILPGRSIPKVGLGFFDHLDKIAHFTVYAILSILMAYEIYERRGNLDLRGLVTIWLICFAYGLLLEIVQLMFLSDRSFEFPDIIANIIGSLVGGIFVYVYYRKKKKV
ncbi:MAG: VanZ family protein [Saprospiraceae bacterium]|nr:VanZ family protein [Saprospiraceae bacterium]